MTGRTATSSAGGGSAARHPAEFARLSASEWCTVAVAVVVASLPAVMPAMVGAMAAQPHVGTEGAGYLVSINMAGIFIGTLLRALMRVAPSAKRMIVAGLSVMMIGNLVTIAVATMPALLAARLISGLGEGFAAGVCFSLMAGARRPANIFAFYAAGQGIIGTIGMGVLPWLVAVFDWRAFYVVLTVLAVPALFLAGPAARNGVDEAKRISSAPISLPGWFGLAMIFLFFVGMALLWAFLQRIGEYHGLGLVAVSGALASTAMAGLAGSLTVAFGGDRLPDRAAWIIGIVLVTGSAASLWTTSGFLFLIGAWALNFAWGFQYPFFFRALARTDPGKGAAVTPMATGIALTVGPALGGWIIEHAGIEAACLAFLALTLGALVLRLVWGGAAQANLLEQK